MVRAWQRMNSLQQSHLSQTTRPFPPVGGSLVGEIVLWSEGVGTTEVPAIVVSETRFAAIVKDGVTTQRGTWYASVFVFGNSGGPFGMSHGEYAAAPGYHTWRFRGLTPEVPEDNPW